MEHKQGHRTRVKFCGLTREKDVDAAVQAGADAVGFVFYPPSKRAVSAERAAELRRRVPAFVTVVALFVNAEPDWIRTVCDAVSPDLLQFHGDETPEQCEAAGRRYIRAFRVGGPGLDTAEAVRAHARQFRGAVGWLFDSDSQGYGGSGHGFDHHLLDAVFADPQSRPVILAGGMRSDTLQDGLAACPAFAVDVSSGIEDAPGIKSAERMQAFMRSLRASDAARL